MSRPTSALIVDDEPHVRAYLRTLLKELGIETCWEAGRGDEVLTLVAANNPGLLLLDLNLPGIGGLDVLRELADAHPEVPVVIVTAHTALDAAKQAAELGAFGYVLKHNSRPQVLAALREVVESLDDGEDEAGA